MGKLANLFQNDASQCVVSASLVGLRSFDFATCEAMAQSSYLQQSRSGNSVKTNVALTSSFVGLVSKIKLQLVRVWRAFRHHIRSVFFPPCHLLRHIFVFSALPCPCVSGREARDRRAMASRLSNTTRCQGMFLVTMPVRAYVFLRISGFRRGGGRGGGLIAA